MTQVLKALIHLAFLSVLWLLVRFTHTLLVAAGLNCEACAVSAAEDQLIVKIGRIVMRNIKHRFRCKRFVVYTELE